MKNVEIHKCKVLFISILFFVSLSVHAEDFFKQDAFGLSSVTVPQLGLQTNCTYTTWPVVVQHLAKTPFDAHDFGPGSEKKQNPVLERMLRFFIVSVGVLPLSVGVTSAIYPFAVQSTNVTKETSMILIIGSSVAVAVAIISLFIR